MSMFRRTIAVSFLISLAVVALPSVTLASDDLTTKVRTAWEKFSELQEARVKYGERAEIALKMFEMETQRAELDTTVRFLKIQVDSFPARKTSLQQEVVDEFNFRRQQLTGLDFDLTQHKLRLQELNEIAIRQAELSGKSVKPLDRVGLLKLLQKDYQESVTAFESLRSAVVEVAEEQHVSKAQVLRNAMESLSGENERAGDLVPLMQFRAAFLEFYPGQFTERSKKSGRVYRKSKSAR